MKLIKILVLSMVILLSTPAYAEEPTAFDNKEYSTISNGGLETVFSDIKTDQYYSRVVLNNSEETNVIELNSPSYLENALTSNGFDPKDYLLTNNNEIDLLYVPKNNETFFLNKKAYKSSTKTVNIDPITIYVKSDFLKVGEEVVLEEGVFGKAIINNVSSNKNKTVETTTILIKPEPKKVMIGTGTETLANPDEIELIDNVQISYPIQGAVITSPYGMRVHPITHIYKLHDGTDFGASCNTEIHPAADGKVISAKYETGYGNRIMIEHADGFVTAYAHLNEFLVSKGDIITTDDVLGLVGSTGYSTGCHLHFMIIINDVTVDPIKFLGES